MANKYFASGVLFLFFILSGASSACASDSLHIELKGYNGLTETSLFAGKLSAGIQPESGLNPSPRLMIEAQDLLQSASSIRSVAQLKDMKERLHGFVRSNYHYLQHSDMLRQLIGRYFMMHEYVDYHVQGAPATNIRLRYEAAVMDGVRSWLDILKPKIPLHEVLNYCVSLYYNRSMVTLASRIIGNFQRVAHCPGLEEVTIPFPPGLALIDADGTRKTLQELGSSRSVTFVSDDCPVSMVETVIEARRSAQLPDTTLIVVPLQPLSSRHLSMRKMVSGGNMLFVNDENWRTENVLAKLKLPRFAQIGREKVTEIAQ